MTATERQLHDWVGNILEQNEDFRNWRISKQQQIPDDFLTNLFKSIYLNDEEED